MEMNLLSNFIMPNNFFSSVNLSLELHTEQISFFDVFFDKTSQWTNIMLDIKITDCPA